MGLPDLNENGELPSGEHECHLEELRNAFGLKNERRMKLFKGLTAALRNLEEAGIRKVFIDGSFITSKEEPNDVDGCWEYGETVQVDKIDEVFLSPSRKPMKDKYGVEFFISQITEADTGLPFPKFFQLNRDGDPKGIVVIRLGSEV